MDEDDNGGGGGGAAAGSGARAVTLDVAGNVVVCRIDNHVTIILVVVGIIVIEQDNHDAVPPACRFHNFTRRIAARALAVRHAPTT
jgi:hypothetical protein